MCGGFKGFSRLLKDFVRLLDVDRPRQVLDIDIGLDLVETLFLGQQYGLILNNSGESRV